VTRTSRHGKDREVGVHIEEGVVLVALRRVATLVAEGVQPQDLFNVVAEEVSHVVDIQATSVVRYQPDGTAIELANYDRGKPHGLFPTGVKMNIDGVNILRLVRDGGEAARIDDYSKASGAMADTVRATGICSTVGVPIIVAGRVWGATVGSTTEPDPLPSSAEARLTDFTELLAMAIENAESREALERLAEEQDALRRVATLVAAQPSPDQVFTAVTEAVGPLLGADLAAMHVFPGDGTARTIAGWSTDGGMIPIGTPLPLDGDSAVARVSRAGAPARMDTYVDVEGGTADVARGLRLRSTVGAPIVVEGKLWGALMAATRGVEPLPEDAESRIAAFTELVATAVSNAEARKGLRRLADEQAALRRVATLVAEGRPPGEIFAAVSDEVGGFFGAHGGVVRFEPDGPAIVFVGVSAGLDNLPVGTRWKLDETMATTAVYRTGRSGRVDTVDWSSQTSQVAASGEALGIVSTVASPIIVEGRRWGAITASSAREVLPVGAEDRLEKFTELVATAVANAESKAELASSRRRIVAASDETRRRIERDLHDGAQQRLVSLALALRAAESEVRPGQDDLRSVLSQIATGLSGAVEDLRELSRGIHPAILSEGGLGPALKVLARRSTIPVVLDVTVEGRLPEAIELGAYFVASEALANTAKHARASRIDVSLALRDVGVVLSIHDDGMGGAQPGSWGLVGLRDRVEALGGRVTIDSPPGGGTRIVAELPLTPA
jgi:signal transduction histidine kinase